MAVAVIVLGQPQITHPETKGSTNPSVIWESYLHLNFQRDAPKDCYAELTFWEVISGEEVPGGESNQNTLKLGTSPIGSTLCWVQAAWPRCKLGPITL